MNDPISYAKKYLEDLLTFFGLNVDVQASREDEVIDLSVPSTHLNGFLIGQRGETLRAIQSLVSNALKNQEFELNRVNIDVADYKRHRRDRLAHQTEAWIQDVRASGQEMSLQPMNAADRRVVHKTVGEFSGIVSESEGEGFDRHVVLKPVKDQADDEEDVATGAEKTKDTEQTDTTDLPSSEKAGDEVESKNETVDEPDLEDSKNEPKDIEDISAEPKANQID